VIDVAGKPVIVVVDCAPLTRAIYRIGVFPAESLTPRTAEATLLPALRTDCKAGTELLGGAVLTEAATAPEPATVTVASSLPTEADSGAPDDEIDVTGDELEPVDGVLCGSETTLPPLQAATPTATSATSAPRRTLSTKTLRCKQERKPCETHAQLTAKQR